MKDATRTCLLYTSLIMSLMRKVARSHGFRLLLHEKPFKGVNGSGKHNNWSLGTDTGVLLMAPGKTAEDNLRFITFIVNTLMVFLFCPVFRGRQTLMEAIKNDGRNKVSCRLLSPAG